MAVTSRPIIALPVGGRLLRPDPPGPAPSCTVTLTNDIASLFGLTGWDTVDGETASTESTSNQVTGVGQTDVSGWSNPRSIEFEYGVVADGASVGISEIISGSPNPKNAAVNNVLAGERLTFVVDGASVEAYRDGVLAGTDTLNSVDNDIVIAIANFNSDGSGAGAASVAAYPDGSNQSHPASHDWCGNAI